MNDGGNFRSDAPWRHQFDNARDPYTARNALGITSLGGGAPATAQYITAATDATLTAERVLTNTASITWDFSTPGQAKASTAGGGGNVSNSGTPTAGQYGRWVTATTIQGVAPATVLSDIGAQPLDTQLTALATVAGGADQVPYFTSTSATAQTTLTSFARTLIDDVDAATMRTTLGVQVAGSYQPLDGELTAIAGLTSAADQAPYFTGSGAAALMTVTAAARTVLDDTTVGAMLTTMGGLSSATAASTYQPLNADLTAIAALTGTNTIYYRSTANTWAAVNVSTGLSFSGGNLTAIGGGGDVFKAGTNVFTAQNFFTNVGVVVGHTVVLQGSGLETHGLSTKADIEQARWSNDINGPIHYLDKSRGTTIGTYTAVASADVLGEINFRGSEGSVFRTAAFIRGLANGTPSSGIVPGAIQLYATNAAGSQILCGSISPGACNFIGVTSVGNAPSGYVGEVLAATNSIGSFGINVWANIVALSLTAGDWDVCGGCHVTSAAAGGLFYISISTTSNTPTPTAGYISSTVSGPDIWCIVGPAQINVSVTTTVYLVGINQTTAAGAVDARIWARRVR